MSDNPFSEPDDSDRTIIRPSPGGRRPAAPPPQTPASPFGGAAEPPPNRPASPFAGAPAAAQPAEGAEHISFGLNPLISAAAPLLQLLGRLRNTYSQPNPLELRDRTLQQVRAFDRAARDTGVPGEQVDMARYALCASLDDVVQATPWGGEGGWASRPLVLSFGEVLRSQQGVQSGVGFFRLLDEIKQRPGAELPLLELMYLCLSLGFQGRYRTERRGPAELDRIREDLYTVITRQRQSHDPALSPHWQGVVAPYKPARAVVPGWVMGVAAAALIGALFVWFSSGLNAASDNVYAAMLQAPLSHMPAIQRAAPVRPPPPPPVVQPDPLYVFLKPEIDQGLVRVLGDHAMPIVRIQNAGMFGSGSAVVSQRYVPLLERIGEALKRERGPVQVIGYTDNQPIHTVQFPSNYQLSKARAEAARAIIVRALGEPARVTAEGRADADPIASNATPQGREENRRIEVVLRREGG